VELTRFADIFISGCVPVFTKRIYVLELFSASVDKHAAGDGRWFVLQWKIQGRSEDFYKCWSLTLAL
jgi:hypothetical protein